MFIGVCTIEMHIPESGSLKTKRHSLKSLKDRIRRNSTFPWLKWMITTSGRRPPLQ